MPLNCYKFFLSGFPERHQAGLHGHRRQGEPAREKEEERILARVGGGKSRQENEPIIFMACRQPRFFTLGHGSMATLILVQTRKIPIGC